ncbi:receptor protein kinase-like protein At4g34220 [Gastrolobium bilobum]|uniref:receptor protein kinase-like protein At4g34220 n=1 Tax=Gastrolobium bilobum TaxID=150636 RepID=UPI002AB20122|nr:receptor protein kinase-like protein At4g34220 [Gastrolobium bilobum]
MSLNSHNLHLWWRVSSFLLLLLQSVALNSDGVLLLKFKYSILSDPLSVLESWNFDDATPCSWHGVTCTEIEDPGTPDLFRVTSLVLPNSQLLGSIAEELGMIQYLSHLDLSNNLFNGSLPISIFNYSQLQVLSLSNNVISGKLPNLIGKLTSLQFFNLSDNAFAGLIPENLTALQNLTVVSLKSNYFSGGIPNGFNSVEILDLSSNLLNGSLPNDFGGESLRYLNVSYNKISGTIPPAFAEKIPRNTTIDLSFNNLTGPIPESLALLNLKTELLSGNADLCGKPLKILCSIPSTMSTSPPNITNTSSPAIAAIPKTIDTNPTTNTTGSSSDSQGVSQSGLKPATIAAIVVGDLVGVAVLALFILFVYQQRKRRDPKPTMDAAAAVAVTTNSEKKEETVAKQDPTVRTPSLPCSSCLTIKEETSEATSSDSDHENTTVEITAQTGNFPKEGTLVTVDGETRLELETLLKASAYILGNSNASIVYKAVLEDGRAFAVRRVGECGIERMKDFENQVRSIAKLRHPNLVKVRAFCWGHDEKLVISDYVPNGNLASIGCSSSSPFNLALEVRLKIAKGVARGLAFIHDKKHVHGNVKPSNILLNSEMEPIISDFGLDRLLLNDINQRANGSARQLMVNQRTQQDHHHPMDSSPYQMPYQAPESLQNIKPNPKWDVYSFGIVLLELLTGRVFSDRELDQWPVPGSVEEEKTRFLRMADVDIKSEMEEGRENVILACFKLGLNCASLVPQKRPSMKEALQILDKSIHS